MPFPVIKVGPGDEIMDFNRHFLELTGQTRESLQSSPVLEIVATVSRNVGQEDGSGNKRPMFKTTNVNGETVYIQTHVIEYRDGDDRDARLILFQDATDQVSLRDENQHMARLASVGKLLSFVVHEIGNFTTVIKGCAQLIEINDKVDDDLREEAGRIGKETDRIDDIIKRFLGFARKGDNEVESIQADSLLRDVIELKRFTLKRKKVSIDLDVRDEIPLLIEGNRTLLMQVMMNLVDNAEEAVAGRPKAKIGLKLSRSGDQAVIEVSDSGPGIPDSQSHKIFDAFFTTKEKDSGTGLGLSISRRIIRNHDGDLTLQSSAPDSGTVFRISLPAVEQPASRPASRKHSERERPAGQ